MIIHVTNAMAERHQPNHLPPSHTTRARVPHRDSPQRTAAASAVTQRRRRRRRRLANTQDALPPSGRREIGDSEKGRRAQAGPEDRNRLPAAAVEDVIAPLGQPPAAAASSAAASAAATRLGSELGAVVVGGDSDGTADEGRAVEVRGGQWRRSGGGDSEAGGGIPWEGSGGAGLGRAKRRQSKEAVGTGRGG
jgi:hypothetical protein